MKSITIYKGTKYGIHVGLSRHFGLAVWWCAGDVQIMLPFSDIYFEKGRSA